MGAPKDEKLQAIRAYLSQEFKDYEMADKYDIDRQGQTFRLFRNPQISLITFSKSFLDDASPDEIPKILGISGLARYVGNDKIERIVVTTKGIEPIKKE